MEKHKGRYLGNKLTEELLAAIREYDTSKIDVGDYFVINGIKFYVDRWLFSRTPNVTETHHIEIMPEKPISVTCKKIEDGGYRSSISWFCNPLSPYFTQFWGK